MTRPIASVLVLCTLMTSSMATIDVYNMDAGTLRDHTLIDIARALALEFPTEINEALMELAEIAYGEEKFGEDIFNRLTSSDAFADAERCSNCETIFTAIATACRTDLTYNQFVQFIIGACETVIESINNATASLNVDRVDTKADLLCKGVVLLHAPHIRIVLNEASTRPGTAASAATEFCRNLNQCIPPATGTSGTSSSTSSQFTINDRREKSSNVNRGSARSSQVIDTEEVITVVQLTDIHVEQDYAVGSPTDCGLPVCCLGKWNGTGKGKANRFGDFNCNVPQETVEMFLSKVQKMNPDVILFSGDIPPSTIWEETEESQTNCSVLLTESIKRVMPNNTVYPCIGNHETYPTNLFSYKSLPATRVFTAKFFDLWKDVAGFPADQRTHIVNGGYYSMLIKEKLRLLAYNSNYMYTFNWYNTMNIKGVSPPPLTPEITPMQEFMKNTLTAARAAGEKVILLGHHPIGGSDSLVSLSRWYQSLVVDFSDIIVLQPTGHTHLDEMRLIYNSSGHPVSVVLVSPSISAEGTKNPSMRIYYLKKSDYTLVDFEQYYLNLRGNIVNARANRATDLTDAIRKLYSAKDTYQMSDLSPQSWHDLVERFESDRTLLNHHLSLSNAAASVRYICLEDCQHDYICRQRNAVFDKYTECVDTFNGTRTGDLIRDLIRPINTTSTSTTTLLPTPGTESSGCKTGALHMDVLLLACLTLWTVIGCGLRNLQ